MRAKAKVWSGIATTMALGVLVGTAQGAVSYSYVTEATSFSKNANETFTVNLYLQETRTNGSASILSSENGLGGAGVRVTRNASANLDPTEISDINRSAALLAGPGFENVSSDEADFSGSVGITDTQGAQPVDIGGGISQVLLGTLTMQAGFVPGESTTFTIGKLNDFNGNTLTFINFYDLDVSQATPPAYTGAVSTNFTVTVVPEPTSVALLGVAGMLLVRRRTRD